MAVSEEGPPTAPGFCGELELIDDRLSDVLLSLGAAIVVAPCDPTAANVIWEVYM